MNSAQPGWVLDPARLQSELTRFGFREGMVLRLLEAAERANHLPGIHGLLRDLLKETLEKAKSRTSTPDHPLLPALAIVAGFPDARLLHQKREIPESITNATFRDLERSIDGYHEKHGVWGFNDSPWLRRHLAGELYEIGRLQYTPGTMGLPYHVFRSKADGNLVCFARDGLACTAEGWPMKEADGFVAAFSRDDTTVRGHSVSAKSGKMAREMSAISLEDYEWVASPESELLFVHIPKGGKLTRENCGESLQKADAFFPKHFPEVDWKGFGCVSWLLDRELDHCLPADSGVLAFSHRFFPLMTSNANGDQIIERVFGPGGISTTMNSPTSLQKSVLAHLKAGGQFRTTGGIIPRR